MDNQREECQRPPRDGIYPRQDRLTRAVSVPHAMYPQPRFLEQVNSLFPAHHMRPEETKQSRAQGINQSCRRIRIGLLVALHPVIQVCKRVPWSDFLLKTRLHLLTIRGGNLRSYALWQHFFKTPEKLEILDVCSSWPSMFVL